MVQAIEQLQSVSAISHTNPCYRKSLLPSATDNVFLFSARSFSTGGVCFFNYIITLFWHMPSPLRALYFTGFTLVDDDFFKNPSFFDINYFIQRISCAR